MFLIRSNFNCCIGDSFNGIIAKSVVSIFVIKRKFYYFQYIFYSRFVFHNKILHSSRILIPFILFVMLFYLLFCWRYIVVYLKFEKVL